MNKLHQTLRHLAQTQQYVTLPEMNTVTGRFISAPYTAPTGLTPYTVKLVIDEYFSLDPIDMIFVSRIYNDSTHYML